MFVQPCRLSDESLGHPEANSTTASSVICSQPSSKLRVSDVSCGHPEATATTAASVICSQPVRFSDEILGHFETTAATSTSVICLQPLRTSDESWGHFETTAATAASSTVRYHSRRSAHSRTACRARHAALRKDLLKCALETRSARGFPERLARSTRSSLGNSARSIEPSTRA